MRVLCVIPARLGSTRLTHKPLRLVAGEPLIRRVATRVMDLQVTPEVVVATDDRRVEEAVAGLDVATVRTSSLPRSGTERAAEVLSRPEYRTADVILNVQGDEPLIGRAAVVGALERVTLLGDDIGTAAAPLLPERWSDPHSVKVEVEQNGRAVAFFRLHRPPSSSIALHRAPSVWQHVGVYAYRATALRRWVALPATDEEREERLEQLRPLVHGLVIGVAVQPEPAAPGVDTEADLREVEERLAV